MGSKRPCSPAVLMDRPAAAWPHSGPRPDQQWLCGQIQAARVQLGRPTGPLPPAARARAACCADAQSASTAASVAWPAASTWRKDDDAIFTDRFTEKQRTRRAWSRGPSCTGEAWRRGGRNSLARHDLPVREDGGMVSSDLGKVLQVGGSVRRLLLR
jgi:hypothetical protein